MPIYEYGCEKCGHHLELLQKIGDPAPKRCPNCRKGKMQKLISRTSFQLKGSGWYVSDYGKKPTASSDSKDSKSEAKTESKTETKTESKPAKDSAASKAA